MPRRKGHTGTYKLAQIESLGRGVGGFESFRA